MARIVKIFGRRLKTETPLTLPISEPSKFSCIITIQSGYLTKSQGVIGVEP